jgi:hypothetical protein
MGGLGSKWAAPIVASMLMTAQVLGCGGAGHEAPVVEVQDSVCPTVDETLSSTMDAARAGRLSSLAPLFEQLEARDGLTGALRVVLHLLRTLGPEVVNARAVSALKQLAIELQPTLLRLLAPYAAAADASDRDALLAFDAAAEMFTTCPDGTFTGPLAVLLQDRELLDSLVALLDDPQTLRILEDATGPLDSEAGQRGFIALLDAIGVALASENFDFDGLVALVGTFMPVDEPPLSRVLAAARPLLVGDNLATFRAAVQCMNSVSRDVSTRGTQNGMQLVAAALYELVAQELGDLASLLQALRPLLTESADADLLMLVRTVSDAVGDDSELRNELVELVSFGLELERVSLVLDAGRALLEAGSLPEGVEILMVLSEEACSELAAAGLHELSGAVRAP